MAEILELSNEKRVTAINKAVTANSGKPLASDDADKKVEGLSRKDVKSGILADLKVEMAKLDALRKGDDKNAPVDISLAQYAQDRWGFGFDDKGTPESFYNAIGVNPSNHSIQSLMTMGEIDEGYRFLIPEIFREAVRLGLRRDPIYKDLIRAEENVSQMKLTMPDIKMSDAVVRKIGELQSIQTGSLTFGSKDVKIEKMAIGIKMSDEAVRYSALNMLAIYLEDVGTQLGMGLDVMAIETLLNGDQPSGSDSAAVIGVDTVGTFAYKDMLRAWLRMQRIGNLPTGMLMNENPAMDILQMDEFKHPYPQFAQGSNPSNIAAPALNIRTALPQSQDLFVHAGMPNDDYLMLVNKNAALIKLNATALRVEQERNAQRQFDAYYVSITTGFATLKRDARLIIDKSKSFAAQGFPAYFNVSLAEKVEIKD